MVRFNEALLVGISLLAALVLSKGRGSVSSLSNIPFISPFTDLLGKAQAQAIEKQETNIGTLENIRQSNLGIAQDILNYEKNISNVKINQLQTELDKTQSFISQEQRFLPVGSRSSTPVRSAVYEDRFAWQFSNFKNLPLDSILTNNILKIRQTDLDKKLMAQQSQYETAQQNITKANELIFKQQSQIDKLQEEYQTRFGGLSRYG
ncbi:MAG: hypothetical protein HOB54_06860 [Flavobacteriales bacterium]|jgi:hypothetical protein|nr:hypothetical protein [Flavobacteriales bacterium]